MEDRNESLPWDYFLTNYERDLLNLHLEDAVRKYPEVSRQQIATDLEELIRNQEQFSINNRQNGRNEKQLTSWQNSNHQLF
jgi:hypothetical protein